jgi:hypothetical protein
MSPVPPPRAILITQPSPHISHYLLQDEADLQGGSFAFLLA